MKPSKRDRKIAQIDLYLKQVARPAQKGQDPNDRRYDREVEREMRKIKPEELDALLNAESDREMSGRVTVFGPAYSSG